MRIVVFGKVFEPVILLRPQAALGRVTTWDRGHHGVIPYAQARSGPPTEYAPGGLWCPSSAVASIHVAGRVLSVSSGGHAEVRRRSGARVAASPGLVLLGGDTFDLQGDTEVKALVYGEFRRFSPVGGGREVAARPGGPFAPDDDAYFD